MKTIDKLGKESLYPWIQHHPLAVSEKDLIACLDESRLDPRLMEVCTEFLRDYWWNLDPVQLNKAARRARFPFMLRASLTAIIDHCDLPEEAKIEFALFVSSASRCIRIPPPQLLYAGIHSPGSKKIERLGRNPIPTFMKLNLIAGDLPFNKGRPGRLKSRRDYGTSLDLQKSEAARKVKSLKSQGKSNDQITKMTGINRVTLSQILNHRLEHVSLDYLMKKTEGL